MTRGVRHETDVLTMSRHAPMLVLGTVCLLSACGGEDYGEALCQAQLAQPDPCDFTSACNVAVSSASDPGGPCEAELSVVSSMMPASYVACFEACPVETTCNFGGGVTFDLRTCGCQFDCVRSAPPEYREAVAAYASCLEAQTAVASSCF